MVRTHEKRAAVKTADSEAAPCESADVQLNVGLLEREYSMRAWRAATTSLMSIMDDWSGKKSASSVAFTFMYVAESK